MSDIGDEEVVLHHPMVRKGGRALAFVLVMGPIVAVLLVMGADFVFNTPRGFDHLPFAAGAVIVGAYLMSALIALPGLLMLRRERLTEELHIGKRGMELRQVLPGVAEGQPAVCWRIEWADVIHAKLRYWNCDGVYAGVDIQTRTGVNQRLYATAWEPVGGKSQAGALLRGPPTSIKADALRATSLVQALSSCGLRIEDDTARPQDRLAAWLGLGLGAAAIIAALVFNYIVEH